MNSSLAVTPTAAPQPAARALPLPGLAAPRLPALAGGVIFALGLFLRLYRSAAFQGIGFDESLYVHYLRQLIKVGLWSYPDIVDAYVVHQKTLVGSILPPVRFLYIFFAYLWHGISGSEPLACFHAVSVVFSILCLVLSGIFAWRLTGKRWTALGAFALVACSPLQIHMSQHALVDGFFTFWALLTLWSLWECLQHPDKRGWLAVYGTGMAAMVLTKENAFFVFVACCVIIGLNRWLGFGNVSRPLLLATFFGPCVGAAILVNLAGGLGSLLEVYHLSVSKNFTLPYAVLTGDGPWHRYLLDLLTVSPVVLLLAFGAMFQLRAQDKHGWFLLVFMLASYAIMANLKYGMNLRYATMWDTPLRILAFGQVALLCQRVFADRQGQRRWLEPAATAVIVGGLCALDLWQYHRLAVSYPLYELVPMDLLQALKILKFS